MTIITSVSGRLSKKDLKRLTGATRKGTVGPTTVYYAGVTAPIISSGVAIFVRNAFHNAPYISSYWLLFISTLIAAFAGIAWYLIFMRWSYRSRHGRGDEITARSTVKITEQALILETENVSTHIAWTGIENIQTRSAYTTIHVSGERTVFVPSHWFDGDKSAQKNFIEMLETYTHKNEPENNGQT